MLVLAKCSNLHEYSAVYSIQYSHNHAQYHVFSDKEPPSFGTFIGTISRVRYSLCFLLNWELLLQLELAECCTT